MKEDKKRKNILENAIPKIDPKLIIPIRSINESYDIGMKSSSKEDDFDFKMSKDTYSWVRSGNSYFVSAKPNTESIPAGLYDIKSSMSHGIYIERRSVLLDDIFQMPDEKINILLNDIGTFLGSKEKYEEYGLTYKRGILMYGPPGTGKTSTINLLLSLIIEMHKGIVINMDSINTFIPMVHNIRALEPDKIIMAVIEDLNYFIDYNSTKDFLNILDGNLQVDNVIYLATTNYIDRIPSNIKNRPSRFDIVYEITYPDSASRKYFIEKKLKPDDAKKYNIDKMVTDTNGMSYAHIKELIASVVVMGGDYDFTIKRLNQMKIE